MPRTQRPSNRLDERAALTGSVDSGIEVAYLRAGAEPLWERPHRNGVDITDRPDLWTPYQRHRRESFEERVARYRDEGRV